MARVSAERMFQSHFPRARCHSAKRPFGPRTYFVYINGGEAGEMWVGSGDRPEKAWRDACENKGITALNDEPIREPLTDITGCDV